MRIVFLDAATLGEVSLESIERLGELVKYDLTPPELIVERLEAADVVITNKVEITQRVIAECPDLKLICVAATGTNCIDHDAAARAGVEVKNVAGYSTSSVCQHTIGMLINLASSMHRYVEQPEKWAASKMFIRLDYPILDLAGKTLGIVGLGDIGRAVAVAASALGMEVVALARDEQSVGEEIVLEGNVRVVRLARKEFFAEADAVTLHCPLTPETQGMICVEVLEQMKKSAWLINTGRGDLIVESDLADALKSGEIAGAGLDVLTSEPPLADHVLLDNEVPHIIITPHTAWASIGSREKLVSEIAKNIKNAHFS